MGTREPTLLSSSALLRKFRPDKRLLVGVSGGRDSVALLHCLATSGFKKLTICHFDHQLRGRASRADARFVERLAQGFDFDFELETADIAQLAGARKISIETAARAARVDFFARVACRRQARTIFLGHHADDVVETFLFNLFRGAGAAGLSSLREVSSQKVAGVDLQIVRPFLAIWRTQIDHYVQTHRLKFREDATNRKLAATRNKMRRRIIPYLEKQFGREIRKSIWRAATIAAEENAWMNALLPQIGKELSVNLLREQPVAAQRRLLHSWLRQHEIADINFDLIERIRALLDPDADVAKINLPRNRHARRRAKILFIDG